MSTGNFIVKAKNYEEIAEEIIWHSTKENLTITSAKSVVLQGKDGGVEFKDYDPIKLRKYIIRGWWTDNEDKPITEAQVGDEVRFHIETKDIPDDEIIFISLYDDDKRIGLHEDKKDDHIKLCTQDGKGKPVTFWKVKSNKAVIPIHLNEGLVNFIKVEPDKQIELYFRCSYNAKDDLPENVDLPDKAKDYLKVKIGTSLIIFCNGHYSDIIPGPSQPDQAYWDYFDKGIVQAALKYFNTLDSYQVRYADGSTHNLFAYGSGQDRKDWGEQYAKENLQEWKKIVGASAVYLIGHSEGCAFAAGIAKVLTENGIEVGEMVFLSCDEGDEFSIDYSIPTYQVEYMYFQKVYDIGGNYITESFDWVINTDKSSGGCKGVSAFGIIIDNHLGFQTVHGATVDMGIFKCIEDLKRVAVFQNFDSEGSIFYDQTPTTNGTKFYMVNTHIIATNHPQWNNKTFKIDRSLPYNL